MIEKQSEGFVINKNLNTNVVVYFQNRVKQKAEELLKLEKQSSRNSFLRTSQHVANVPHWCDNCFSFIEPGDIYEKSVFLKGKTIVEFKIHVNPSCESPDDPFDDDYEYSNIENENIFREAA